MKKIEDSESRGECEVNETIKHDCSTCANNVDYPPPHTCDICTSLDEEDYEMWEGRKSMTVREVETFLKTVTDKEKNVYIYQNGDNPFDSAKLANAFEVKPDAMGEGYVEGVYFRMN